MVFFKSSCQKPREKEREIVQIDSITNRKIILRNTCFFFFHTCSYLPSKMTISYLQIKFCIFWKSRMIISYLQITLCISWKPLNHSYQRLKEFKLQFELRLTSNALCSPNRINICLQMYYLSTPLCYLNSLWQSTMMETMFLNLIIIIKS